MTIINQNVELCRGDSAVLSVSLTDANGAPFALSPAGTVKWRLSQTAHDEETDAVIRKELNNGILFDANIADISLAAVETDIECGIYYHELKVYDFDDVTTALTGAFIITPALKMAGAIRDPSHLTVTINATVV